jgi:integrase
MIISRGHLTPGCVAELVRGGERKKHADGAGLYLVVRAPGRGYWIRQFRKNGVLSATGKPAFGSACLGVYPAMSLNAARVERGKFDPAKPKMRRPTRASLAHTTAPGPAIVAPEPERKSGKKLGKRPSLPWPKLPEFWQVLVADDSERSRALRFMILTAARVSNAVRNRDKPIAERTDGDWSEIDLEQRTWTVPRAKLKNKKRDYDHRVPLSDAAIALLGEPRKSGPLFPGVTRQDLSSYIIKARKGFVDRKGQAITIHGFRATFVTWAQDDLKQRYGFEALEFAIDHDGGMNSVQAAYRRGAYYAQRAPLMDDYAVYATTGKLPEGWTKDR